MSRVHDALRRAEQTGVMPQPVHPRRRPLVGTPCSNPPATERFMSTR